MKGLRVLFAGGGTAGHINPALTVADLLRREGAEVAFAGTADGLEHDLVPRSGYKLHLLRVRPLPRRLGFDLVKAGLDAGIGLVQALGIMQRYRPHIVVGTGGYVAGPVLLAAVLRRIPTVIHEQNAFPGGTNRALARWVSVVALGYQEAANHFGRVREIRFVGNPVRSDLLALTREEALRRLNLETGKRTVIVFGGSRGARSINEAVFSARKELHALPRVQVIHQTGAAGFADVVDAYRREGIEPESEGLIQDGNIRVVPYVYDMPAALAAADLVVSRAGAISIAEITARGVPAVLVPYPYATADHQTYNAKPLVAAGAARLIADRDLSGTSLSSTVKELLTDDRRLREMAQAARRLGRPDAAKELAELICRVAGHGA